MRTLHDSHFSSKPVLIFDYTCIISVLSEAMTKVGYVLQFDNMS